LTGLEDPQECIWYYHVSRHNAEEMLIKMTENCFLFRPSSEDGYALSKWSPNAREIVHFRINFVREPEPVVSILDSKIDTKPYPNLQVMMIESPELINFVAYGTASDPNRPIAKTKRPSIVGNEKVLNKIRSSHVITILDGLDEVDESEIEKVALLNPFKSSKNSNGVVDPLSLSQLSLQLANIDIPTNVALETQTPKPDPMLQSTKTEIKNKIHIVKFQ